MRSELAESLPGSQDDGKRATQAEPAIRFSDLSKLFGNHAVLRRISAAIPAGTISLLLGENGAGKSTLLRLIAGLSTPSRGAVHVFGEDPRTMRGQVAYVSHASMLYDELSAPENLRYFASLHRTGVGCACSGSPEMALRTVGIDPTLSRPVSQFSQGMRQRTALACALQSDPNLLLLDEPFSNLDSAGIDQMVNLLADFRTWSSRDSPAGRTVLLTTHQASVALPIADHVLRLADGELTVEPGLAVRRHAGESTVSTPA